MSNYDIGLVGLAVMGENLVLNMEDHGFSVAVFNRTTDKVDAFLAGSAKGTEVIGAHSLEEFVNKLKRPRKIMLMVKAGEPVDQFISRKTNVKFTHGLCPSCEKKWIEKYGKKG